MNRALSEKTIGGTMRPQKDISAVSVLSRLPRGSVCDML